ncbi:AAA family ATPase [Thermoleptolyngbya sichuanensis A183]|uniref:AAA family ATPase n=1 Tax=Thermoleptolyngbya sichuanensis A183 TaxID=2737172 RepID=A0A6M8BC71_9CYAN|nr:MULTISPECIES: AAA family ATPase [Thermoleptolyngbya]QKD84248.1 AAA family ATPase [Thermoleptolyngbya sichuanensis A183]
MDQRTAAPTPTVFHLIVLIGLPGSGKSTLAQVLVNNYGCRLVSTDAIRGRLFGDEATQGPWPLIWQEVEQAFRAVTGVRPNQIVLKRRSDAAKPLTRTPSHEISHTLYDATNAARRQRREVVQLGRRCGFSHITGLWLDVPLSLCLERNRKRDRQVPEPIIEQMHCRLSTAPPSLSDGFDTLIHLPPAFCPDPTTWDSARFGKPHPQFS